MEGHAEMDMAVTKGPIFRRILSDRGKTAISHHFVMDWLAVWKDVAGGLLIAGALSVFLPQSFWKSFFLGSHPEFAKFWGPLVGPFIAIISFVCSVGNIPLAAILWNSGISFGGVIAFVFADLIVIPVLDIYRKYYGLKMAAFILATFYVAMALAALIIEFLFQAAGLVPAERHAEVGRSSRHAQLHDRSQCHFSGNAAVLVVRFSKTGGQEMLKMM